MSTRASAAAIRFLLCTALFLFTVSPVFAQSRDAGNAKRITAHRIDPRSVRLDGAVDEAAWRPEFFVSDFLQKEPTQGAPPSEKTEVAILYDDAALYIGARMTCLDPENIGMHLDRHDNQGPTEQFIVTIDTYHDRRTGYGFGVNTSGVRFDRYNPEDDEYVRDYSFDPVWEAKTSRDEHGWMVEMRIPFSQLRFIDREQQVFGINFNRWIPDRNEDVYWVYVPRNETGWASYFGQLVGIEGIKPSRRLELLPYVAGGGEFTDQFHRDDPFHDGTELDTRLGADLKMGLGPNMTLDATINPDFGQVEADPAEVNLSQYETFFSEKRPFFTEGSQLFEPIGLTYFYSRRIGAPPHLNADGDFVESPNYTSIIGAGKVTGRLGSGLSLGVLSAVTGRERARSYDVVGDSTYRTVIEPPTAYNVARVLQEFGEHGSTVGFMGTAVNRHLDSDGLKQSLNEQAYTGAGDLLLRFAGGKYQLASFGAVSYVSGDPRRIADVQRSPQHYFQRPDADHVTLDSTRTSLTGYTAALSLNKRSGSHWLWEVGGQVESPELELNDAGILNAADGVDSWANLRYRENQPGGVFQSWNVGTYFNSGWNYGGVRQYQTYEVSFNYTLRSFWQGWLGVNRQTRGQSSSRTRGGPVMSVESGVSMFTGINTPFGKATRGGLRFNYGVDELDGWLYRFQGDFTTRLSDRMQLSLYPYYQREEQPRQYVTTLTTTQGGQNTYGNRYVFSRIARTTISLQVRANYFFTPDISLEFYGEPFVASGRFFDHGELARGGTHDLLMYGSDGTAITQASDTSDYIVTDNNVAGGEQFEVPNRDFHALFFRSNLVLRWQFVPGSTLYLVWQRNLGDSGEITRRATVDGLWDTLGGEGEDFFALKISYWIPVS